MEEIICAVICAAQTTLAVEGQVKEVNQQLCSLFMARCCALCVWLLLACRDYGGRFHESFPACACGDHLAQQLCSLWPRISPQWLSELGWLWVSVL